jgi:hypothetical protein
MYVGYVYIADQYRQTPRRYGLCNVEGLEDTMVGVRMTDWIADTGEIFVGVSIIGSWRNLAATTS